MNNLIKKIFGSRFWWLFLLVVLFAVNFLASAFHSRFDLTKEKRYTLSRATKEVLTDIDSPLEIDIFLEGKNLPSDVLRLKNTINEFLLDCKDYTRGNLKFRFVNPYQGLSDTAQSILEDSLNYYYDIFPSVLDAPEKAGDKLEISKIIHGAVIKYQDTTAGINFLKGIKNYGTSREERAALYNNVEATLEYKFASAIQKIITKKKPVIAYALGHGELWGYNVDDAVRTLIKDYQFDTINIKTDAYISDAINALIILKPTKAFTDEDKLKIDQYLMRGGKVFCMIDNMYAEFDSLYKSGGFTAFDRGLNLEDMFFKYGARINQNLLQDLQCDKLPQVSGEQGQAQQQRLVDWPFFPVLNGTDHPISKNLDGVRVLFPNTIDTIKTEGVKKTFLLHSSAHARVLTAPAIINFEFMQIAPDSKMFNVHDTAVAVLLEGKFTSLFRNRISRSQVDALTAQGTSFKEYADEKAKLIVVADGDVATNQYSQVNGPLPMGMNLFTRYTYANKEFYTNALDYLVNPSNILETRAKDFTLRLLDPIKVKEQKTTWQFINIVLPVLLVILFGFIYQQIRKKKYAA
jgi:gliding-associated putative ABC transporter substrate-binding component GldG